MAQTGFTPIQLYSSSTPTNAPSAGNLTNDTKGSELAINIADKNLFFKDSTNAVNTVPIRQSGASSNGWLSSTDWNTFNNKQPAGTYVTSVGATAPVASSGGTTPTISMPAATTSVSGYLTSTDWNTFNNKQAALVSGTNIKTVNGTTLLGSGDVGTIGVGYGGTGLTSVTAGYIPFGSSASALSTSANLFWNSANSQLGLGTSSPGYRLDVAAGDTTAGLGYGMRLRSNATAGAATFQFTDSGVTAQNGYITVTDAGRMGFSDKAYVHSSGGVSIGNTTDPGATNLYVTGTVGIGGTVDSGAKAKIIGATGTNQVLYVVNNTGSGNQGGIRSYLGSTANNTNSYHFNGLTDTINNWYLYGNGTSSWSSDARLKKNIETTRDGYIDDVMKLRVVKYNWKNAEEGTPRELGLIAQEVEQVFPGLVQDDFHQLSEDDPTLYKQLKGSVLPMILLKALQELKQEFDAYVASHP